MINNETLTLTQNEFSYTFTTPGTKAYTVIVSAYNGLNFVSSQLEIHKKTGATICNSEKVGADYPHASFDEGDSIRLGILEGEGRNAVYAA